AIARASCSVLPNFESYTTRAFITLPPTAPAFVVQSDPFRLPRADAGSMAPLFRSLAYEQRSGANCDAHAYLVRRLFEPRRFPHALVIVIWRPANPVKVRRQPEPLHVRCHRNAYRRVS